MMAALAFETVGTFVFQVTRFRFRFRETLDQLFVVAVESVPVIALSVVFVSFMTIAEFSFHMKLVLKQDSLVPAFSTVMMFRELGPLVTCLLLMSRVGAAMAAELGMMKNSEQLDALKILGIDKTDYLIVPRGVACILAGIWLSIVAAGLSVFAGSFLAAAELGYNAQQYFSMMFLYTKFTDVWTCVLKGGVFGMIIAFAACHQGLKCRPGSEGVGNAATHAVVQGSMAIIIADFVLTYLLHAI